MSRMNLAKVVPQVYEAFQQTERAIRKGPMEPRLRELVKIRTSQLNGCVFCLDMHIHEALTLGENADRIFQLPAWRESELFTGAERAALAYTEAATEAPDEVSDEIWDAVTAAFESEESAQLVAQVAMINLWNRVAAPTHARPPRRG